jgi:hypothetical protein
MELFSTDYVIYDKINDHVIQWESNGEMVIYGDKEEAIEDCRGNEYVVSCTELPIHQQKKLINQLKKI